MVTLKEVAREAGLTVGAVSHVLSRNDPRYSPTTRQRVHDIAHRLGYRPNHLARSMVRGRTHTIGVVGHMLSNPLAMERLEIIANELQKLGYQMFLAGRKVDVEFTEEKEVIENLISRRVDGLIIVSEPERDTSYYHELRERKVPFVLTGVLSESENLPVVYPDTAEGTYLATCHLADLGHRDIAAAFGYYAVHFAVGRYEGFERAMRERKLKINPDRVLRNEKSSLESVYEFTKQQLLHTPRPTAIIYTNDEMAVAGLHAIRELGLEVPRDVSVMGFDDLPIARHAWPPLTTIRQPREEWAHASMKVLMDQIQGKFSSAVKRVVLSPRLIVRQSTGPAPLKS